MNTWASILDEILDVVAELANDKQIDKASKLDSLTVELSHVLESLDTAAVDLLPPGLAGLARVLIDNPMIDEAEKNIIVRPVAEMFYQLWRLKQSLIGK